MEADKKINQARLDFEIGNLNQSTLLIEQVLNDDQSNIEALILKAKICYKQQKWGEALNLLNRVLDIDKNNRVALSHKQMIMEIISFWNKDSYNP